MIKIFQVNVKVSKNNIIIFKKSISDKPYTKICSYQPKCDYKCNNVNTELLNNLYTISDDKDIKSI